VIHIDDAKVVALFMDKYKQNQEEALAYLSQWDYGESNGLLTYAQIMEGLTHVNYAANDMYLALWQTGIDGTPEELKLHVAGTLTLCGCLPVRKLLTIVPLPVSEPDSLRMPVKTCFSRWRGDG